MARNSTVSTFTIFLVGLFLLTGLAVTAALAQPEVTLIKPAPGASTALVITFDRELEAATTSITTASGLLSMATNDFGGANTAIARSSSAGTVVWNTAIDARPVAHVIISSTTFVAGQSVRIRFQANAVQDLATSTPFPSGTDVIATVAAYTALHTVDFETTTGYTTVEQIDGIEEFFSRFNKNNENALGGTDDHDLSTAAVGTQGDFYFAGEDINNAFDTGEGAITLDAEDISGFDNLQLRLLIAATGSGYDATGDYIKIEYSFDGGPYTVVGAWGGNQFDGDNNNTGEGFALTANFLDATYIIPNEGSNLTIRVRALNTAGDEEYVFDNIRLSGVTDITPPTAAITYDDPDGRVTETDVIRITATFSEIIKDEPPAMQIELSGANSAGPVDMVKASNTEYYFDHTVGAGDGTVTVQLSNGTDLGGVVVTAAPTSGATFIVDNTGSAAFTTGMVEPVGGTEVAGFWNSTNTDLEVTVPLDNTDVSLDNGQVQIELSIDGVNFDPIANSGVSTITNGERVAGTKVITIDEADLEVAGDFADTETITIRAVITDNLANVTEGAASATTFVVNITPPAVSEPDLAAGSDSGPFNNDNYTNLNSVDFSGTAEADASVELFDGAASLGTITATGGVWSFTGEDIGTGASNITAVATDDAGNVTTSTVLSVTVDQGDPIAFTTGSVTVTGGTIVTGYWNPTNTQIEIEVPIDNDASLEDGTVQIELANATDNDFQPVPNSGLSSITAGEISGGTKTIIVDRADLELNGEFIDGETITFRAIITDLANNSTTGANSGDEIIIDETAPDAFTTGNVESTGGNVVPGFWNSTNTAIEVTVPLDNSDATLDNGEVTIELSIDGVDFDPIPNSGISAITNGERVAGTKTVTIGEADMEAAGDFADTETIIIRAIITDIASNATTGGASATTFVVDMTPPAVSQPNLVDAFDSGPNSTDNYTNLTTVDFSGTAEADASVELFDEAVSLGTTTATGGVWSFTGVNIGTGASNITAVATNAAGSEATSAILIVTVDQTSPVAQAPTDLETIGGRVVTGYWNATNTDLEVTVPLENSDVSLTNGRVQIQLQNTQTNTWVSIANTGLSTIADGERSAGEKVVSVSNADLELTGGFTEGLAGGFSSSETRFIQIRAVVSDLAGNTTNWTKSATDVDVDQIPPAVAGGIVVVSNGGASNKEAILFQVSEPMTNHADPPVERADDFQFIGAVNTFGSTGLSVEGTGDGRTDNVRYLNGGGTNAIDGSFTNDQLIFVESSGNNSGWTVANGTDVQYVPGLNNDVTAKIMRDPAGNQIGAFTQQVSAGTTTDLGAAASQVAASPLINSAGDRVVFAFSLLASNNLNLTSLTISTTADPDGLLGDFRLYSNTLADLGPSLGATDLSLTPTVNTNSVTFGLPGNTLTIPLAAGLRRYFYLVANVDDYFFSAAPQIQFSLTTSDFTVSTGSKTGTDQTGTLYTLDDNTSPTIISIENSVNPIYEGALTQTVKVIYNEPMDPSTEPAILLSGAHWGMQTDFGGTNGWTTTTLTNDTYTATFTHTASQETVLSATASIGAASTGHDWGGNGNSIAAVSDPFLLDNQKPTVSTITASPAIVSINNKILRVAVTYNEGMNTTVAPTITFSPLNGNLGTGVPFTGTIGTVNYVNGWKTTVPQNVYVIDYTHNLTVEELGPFTANANGARDAAGATGNLQTASGASNNFTIDTKVPEVTSIVRDNPASPTSASSVTFKVTFTEPVLSVNFNDFNAAVASGSFGVLSVGNPVSDGGTGTDDVWFVSVGGISGDGEIRLDLSATAFIVDVAGNDITETHQGDEVYLIDQTPPNVTTISIDPALTETWANPHNGTSDGSITFEVNFNDDVTGVDATDFEIVASNPGSVSFTSPVVVTGSGDTWTVTINDVKLLTSAGSQLRINLLDDNTIKDAVGNSLGGPALNDGDEITDFLTATEYYTILFPEPSDPAINFSITGQTTTGFTINWAHAVAPQTPPTHYAIQVKKSTVPAFPTLVDGVFPENTQDGDFSDGTLGLIVGGTTTSFNTIGFGVNLNSGLDYDIRIISFTYSGTYPPSDELIDYLTGTPLEGSTNTLTASQGTLTFNSSATAISSLSTTASGVQVFSFTLNEDGGATTKGFDDAPTKFDQLVITPGALNNVGDWTTAIAGAELRDANGKIVAGTVNAGNITFASIPSNDSDNPDGSGIPDLGYVPDNVNKEFRLRIWLDDPLGVDDNSLLDFAVNNASFTGNYDDSEDANSVTQRSSQLAPAQLVQSGQVRIDVQATRLEFTTDTPTSPAQIGVKTNFPVPPVVKAFDTKGNLDLDYENTFSVTSGISLFNGHTNFIDGVLTLSNFNFTAPGTTTITISGNAGGIYPAIVGANDAESSSITAVISSLSLISQGPDPEPATLSSLITKLSGAVAPQQNAVQNFDFTIADDAGANTVNYSDNDGLPTEISQIVFNQGAGNDGTYLTDWTKVIEGAQLVEVNSGTSQTISSTPSIFGAITATTLQFDISAGSPMSVIGDDDANTYQLRIWLSSPVDPTIADFIDNKFFEFEVSEATITTFAGNTSSVLQAANAASGASNQIIVTATQIDFTTQWPVNAPQSYDAHLAPNPVARTRDANGNLDIDYNTAVAITTSNATTFPLANETVTINNGLITFDAELQVTSAGGGANNAPTFLELSSGGLTDGVSNVFRLNYSAASDIVIDGGFTYPTNILYADADNQVGDITSTTGIAVAQFILRDGGASGDSDGTITELETITLNISNHIYLRSIALYEGSTEIAELDASNISPTGDLLFSTLATFQAPDDGTNSLTVKVTFRDANVDDNQVINFRVIDATTGGVSSAFDVSGTATAFPALAAEENQIEVVATSLDIIFPAAPTAVSINTPFTPSIAARDVNNNLDLDFEGAASTITAFENVSSNTVANGPVVGATQFADGLLDFSAAFPNFQFTSGDNNDDVTLSIKAGTGTNCGVDAICTDLSPALTLKSNTITAGALSEPGAVSSLTTTIGGIQVFDFDINDDDLLVAGTDTSPTRISQIVISELTGDDITDWTELIAGASLSDGVNIQGGTVSANTITFSSIANNVGALGYVDDNASKTYTLSIWLHPSLGGALPATVDNLNIAFEILATNISVVLPSSTFSVSENENSGATNLAVDVQATKLVFTTNPAPDLLVNKDISLQPPVPVVEAWDANNNLDIDFFSSTVTVTNNDGLPMTNAPGNADIVNGILTFDDAFQYNAIGDGTLTVAATGTSVVTAAISDAINVRVGLSGTIKPGVGTEPATLSSLVDTDPEKIQVFDFTITDDDGLAPTDDENDGNPIAISQVTITQEITNNEIADWSQAIAGATLTDGTNSITGTVNASTITFGGIPNAPGTLGHITDNGSKTFELHIFLHPALGGNLPTTIDGLNFGFQVLRNDVLTDPNGTSILPGELENSGANNEVAVTATKLSFSQLDGTDNFISPYSAANFPATGSINTVFAPRLGVEAHDANNNRDLDFTGTITDFHIVDGLTTTNDPSGPFASGALKFPANFQYTSGVDEDGQITMTAGGITSLSPAILISSSFESVLDLDAGFTPEPRIPYISNQDITSDATSFALAQFQLSDGDGLTPDTDGAATNIDDLTFSVTNPENIRGLAIYMGSSLVQSKDNADFVTAGNTTVTFSDLFNDIIAPDNGGVVFTVRASFFDSPAEITDNDMIQLHVESVTQNGGSKFNNVVPNPIGGLTNGAITDGAVAIEVLATELDFIVQPPPFAGINEPITEPVIHAIDAFGVIDVDQDENGSADTPGSLAVPGAGLSENSYPFNLGVMNTTSLQYTAPGDGTITVSTINDASSPVALQATSTHVDVIHVTTELATDGVFENSLAGGAEKRVIFGFTIKAPYTVSGEPKLEKFTISFATVGTIVGVFNNIKIFESLDKTFQSGLDTDVTFASIGAQLVLGSKAVTVDFASSGIPRDLSLASNNELTYFLMVDVDESASGSTPTIQPRLEAGGFGSLTEQNIVMSKGSSFSDLVGTEFNFAAILAPTVVSSFPASGQLNVAIDQPTIDLVFTVPVWTLDGKIYLHDYETGALVSVLSVLNNNGLFVDRNSPAAGTAANPLRFSLPPLDIDRMYYIVIPPGDFKGESAPDNVGIMDQSDNESLGFSYSGVLYFKTTDLNPPQLLESPKPPGITNISLTGATINGVFDQLGKAYFLVTEQSSLDPVPTNAQIRGDVSYPAVIDRGSFDITQTNSVTQFGVINANLDVSTNYEVWIYAEGYSVKDGDSTAIETAGPFGNAANDFAVNTTGPTLTFTTPASPSANVTIFPSNLVLCSNSFQVINSPIVIVEGDADDFFTGGVERAFNLLLPSGYQFDDSKTDGQFNHGKVSLYGADFVPGSDSLSYINNSILRVSFKSQGTASLDNITITGLRIFGASSSPTGSIVRLGGDAITTVPDNTVFGSISTSDPDPVPFTNSYSEEFYADRPVPITIIPNNSSQVGLPPLSVQLIPEHPDGDYGSSTFSGAGVNVNLLNLSAVALGIPFNITMTHTDNNGCISTNPIQYTVYDHENAIGLETKYCLVNVNYPDAAPLKSDSVVVPFDNNPTAYMRSLKIGLPTSALPTQVIKNTPEWLGILESGFVDSTEFDIFGDKFYTYKFNFEPVLNADSVAGIPNPYIHFIERTPIQQNIFYNGGSLGMVEFSAEYRGRVNTQLEFPLKQIVEFYVPPIPIVEVDESNLSVIDTSDPLNPVTPGIENILSGNEGTPIFCVNGGVINIAGYPRAEGESTGAFTLIDEADSTIIYNGTAIPGFTDNRNGTATLDPKILNNAFRDIRIIYSYQNSNSPCGNMGSKIIRITPNPVASFTTESVITKNSPEASALCVGIPINFDGSGSTISNGNIETFHWDFADDANQTGANPNKIDGTADVAQAVAHTFIQSAQYLVSLAVVSNFGCASEPSAMPAVSIGAIPEVNFTFTGISTADKIEFKNGSVLNSAASIDDDFAQMIWRFGDLKDNDLPYDTTVTTVFNNTVKHKYKASGKYDATLVVTSSIGCTDTLALPVIILPRVTPNATTAYSEDFERAQRPGGNWQAASIPATLTDQVNYSWDFGFPLVQTDPAVNGTTVWKTNIDDDAGYYNALERSALYSPSFDLRELTRPIVSFYLDTDIASSDGVVLEYSVDNKNVADPDKKWHALGKTEEGIKWFNAQGIAAKPGNQPTNDFGWTGSQEWVEAKHAITNETPDKPAIVGSDTVVFRFAFASAKTDIAQQGFALDNFRLGNGTRTVLLENFSNTSANTTAAKNHNALFREFNEQGNETELVKIDYHVAFPGEDPFNDDNPTDPGARAFYYGVAAVPHARLDGQNYDTLSSTFVDWGERKLSEKVLDLANANIVISPPELSNEGILTFDIEFTPLIDLPGKTILHVAVVENSILVGNNEGLSGRIASGETEFRYVLKKLLPNAGGTVFTGLTAGDLQAASFSYMNAPLFLPNNDIAIVAFLQNESTRQVYQSEIVRNVLDPGTVTSIEDLDNYFNVYPNPSDKQLVVELPIRPVKSVDLKMYDAVGQVIRQSTFEKGEMRKELDTHELAAGVYVIQVRTEKGILTRKVMVVHRN